MRRTLSSPWTLAAVGVAAITAACVSTAPVYRPGAPIEPRAPLPPIAPQAPAGPPRFVSSPSYSCVPYARLRSGFSISGDANLWWAAAAAAGYQRGPRPALGSVLVLRIGTEGARGHVSYVTRVVSPREILVDHANWHGRGEVAVDVPVIDVSPANDWSQVRVFWLDSGQMGQRIYPAEGFILPQHPAPDA